jgi:phosphoglycolate phosphatase-like HAD superfamily hydrolase
MKQMGIKRSIYVGDSVEDIIMVEKAKEFGLDVQFIGVYGSSSKPRETINALKLNGAELVLRSVNKLPNILNKVM